MLSPATCLLLVRLSSFLFINAFLNFYFYFLSQLLYCTLTCFSIVILIYFSLSSLYVQCCLFFKYFHLIDCFSSIFSYLQLCFLLRPFCCFYLLFYLYFCYATLSGFVFCLTFCLLSSYLFCHHVAYPSFNFSLFCLILPFLLFFFYLCLFKATSFASVLCFSFTSYIFNMFLFLIKILEVPFGILLAFRHLFSRGFLFILSFFLFLMSMSIVNIHASS